MEERLSVLQFNKLVNSNLKQLGEFVVEGEIAQMSVTQRGGLNIELKDPKSQAILRVSGYAPYIQGIDFVREGTQVAVWGSAELWEERGLFSLKARKILPLGEGALKEAFEKLKLLLSQEGLFEPERKRQLPRFITRIALLTAAGSAAQSDFLKILRENNAAIEIDFYPVHVQGKLAEREIISSLRAADKNDYDCIVITRGGGSLQDLIAFNDEKLARTIFACKTVVLAAVGHERDESIAEYVADIRASTPSQAAYYLVSRNQEFLNSLTALTEQMQILLDSKLSSLNSHLATATDAANNKLNTQLQLAATLLEHKSVQLASAWSRISAPFKTRLDRISSTMFNTLHYHLRSSQTQLNYSDKILSRFKSQVSAYSQRIENYQRLLKSYDPRNVLKRGYALITTQDNHILTSVKNTNQGAVLGLQLKDGSIISKVLKIKHENKNQLHPEKS